MLRIGLLAAATRALAEEPGVPVKYCQRRGEERRSGLKRELYPNEVPAAITPHAEQAAITVEDIITHPDYNASHSAFVHIVKDLMAGTSFHSSVHILRPLLSLTCSRHHGQCVYLEIGSFCGASMALALSYPRIDRTVSVSHPHFRVANTPVGPLYAETVKCLNLYRANHTQLPMMSGLAHHATKVALDGYKVDVLLIDGNHDYGAVLQDFDKYAVFVRPGGAILMDDYGGGKEVPGVKQAVTKLTRSKAFCTEKYHCLGQLPNLAGADSTCAYQQDFWRKFRAIPAGGSVCPQQPAPHLNNEYVLIKR